MSQQAAQAMIDRLAFRKTGPAILEKAIEFYGLGFELEKLSSSQISAVGNCLRNPGSFEDARNFVCKFIDLQLEKLRDKAEEGGEVSWLSPAKKSKTVEGEKCSLGELLMDWIDKEKYLENVNAQNVDRLRALRLFWSYVKDQYHYRKAFGENMKIENMSIKSMPIENMPKKEVQ